MNNIDISIIMPCYNSESTINDTLDSILSQKTKYNFELLVIDDGSTDRTTDIIKRRMKSNDNIRLFLQDHLFQAEARNKGVEEAKGNYIMFSDDDDLYLPGYVEKMGNKIINHKLVICGIEKLYSDDSKKIENKSILEQAENKTELIGDFLTKNQEFDVGLWNKIFVKQVLIDNNIKMSNKNFFEDSMFVLNYLMVINRKDIVFLNDVFYVLKKRAGSTTNSYDDTLWTKCNKYIGEVENITKESPKLRPYLASFKVRITLFYIHRSILNNPKWTSKKQRKIIKENVKLISFNKLNLKYTLALSLAFLIPNAYIDLYRRKESK